jgi:hypothetical protein
MHSALSANETLYHIYGCNVNKKLIPIVFNKNAIIRDKILKLKAIGHERIRHYYNEIDFLYKDILLLKVQQNTPNEYETKWKRTRYDTDQTIFGLDRIIITENKIVNILTEFYTKEIEEN